MPSSNPGTIFFWAFDPILHQSVFFKDVEIYDIYKKYYRTKIIVDQILYKNCSLYFYRISDRKFTNVSCKISATLHNTPHGQKSSFLILFSVSRNFEYRRDLNFIFDRFITFLVVGIFIPVAFIPRIPLIRNCVFRLQWFAKGRVK